jgi:hypothetical protein
MLFVKALAGLPSKPSKGRRLFAPNVRRSATTPAFRPLESELGTEQAFPKAKVASSILAGGAAPILEEQRKNDGVRRNPWQRCGALDRTRHDAIGRFATRAVATGRQRANGKLCSPKTAAEKRAAQRCSSSSRTFLGLGWRAMRAVLN